MSTRTRLSADHLDMFANLNYRTLDTFSDIIAARLQKKTVVEECVEVRRRRGWQLKLLVRRQHQAVDNMAISQCVRAADDHSRLKELVSQTMLANDQT